ncbi:phosphoglycolate phosphatase [Paracoccus isoporae]|uniref:phosphoglycolate phosphatase n=1 Tax=Paracoccus isoporae TaxID=591205 RepID=A0A1G6TEU8_9RHOB|nr:HAD-IA family hydrolase [Paracoccus isoporae]SDD27682.1 phosphoglycolate phosphatase [Paracoccus isoporae]
MAGTVVFDLDGTLADTAADLIGSANEVLARRGLEGLDPVADAAIAFSGGRAMLREGYGRAPSDMLIPPDAEEVDFPLLLDAYDAAIAVHTRLYPGVEAALTRLAGDGHTLTVCTNKPEALAHKLLLELGVRDAFSVLIGADSLTVRKPDPVAYHATVERAGGTVAQSFMLGDTITDVRTAAAAGVRVALVSFGPEGTEIARLKPDAMLDHYDDLPELARGWLG